MSLMYDALRSLEQQRQTEADRGGAIAAPLMRHKKIPAARSLRPWLLLFVLTVLLGTTAIVLQTRQSPILHEKPRPAPATAQPPAPKAAPLSAAIANKAAGNEQPIQPDLQPQKISTEAGTTGPAVAAAIPAVTVPEEEKAVITVEPALQHTAPVRETPASASRPSTETALDRSFQTLRNRQAMMLQLRGAIQQENESEVNRLLTILRNELGEDNLASIKMHAYWFLRKKDYPTAREYYQRLLAKQPNDLTGNTNLALIQWRTGNENAARERLLQMRTLHPEDKTVRRYLATMEQGQ